METEPMYKCAGTLDTTVCEGEEKIDAANGQAKHSRLPSLNEDGITPRIGSVPIRVRSNALVVHSTCSTQIAQCVETGFSRVVDIDAAPKIRADVEGDIGRKEVRVGMIEFVQETTEEMGKVGLMDVGCKRLELPRIVAF
jgi:hypothetical protein